MADGRWPMADGRWPMADGRKVALPGRRSVLHQPGDHPPDVIGLIKESGNGCLIEATHVTRDGDLSFDFSVGTASDGEEPAEIAVGAFCAF
jgi:hypothetical protein